MIEQEILAALQGAAMSAVVASAMPSLPIKFAGRSFEVPDDQKYLELIRIPNNVENEFWGDEKTYRGLFRIILHWQLDDQGAYPPMIVLQSIVSYFETNKSIDVSGISVKILEKPNYMGEMEASPEMLFPVSIRYQCFKP